MPDEQNLQAQPFQEESAVQNVSEEKNELEELKKKADEYLNGWKRAQADFANYKKDEVRRFEELAKYATGSFMKDLLVVLDSFDLALVSREGSEASQKGILIIKSQLLSILKSRGLEEIKVKPGEDVFNPSIHEAVTERESDKASETVIEVVEKGYTLHGKIVRPVRVVIAK